jgi:hypothetical protein
VSLDCKNPITPVISAIGPTAESPERGRPAVRLWPYSVRRARAHAILTAIILWIGLVITFTAGAGDRSIAGPIKGADFLQFYTMGSLVRTGRPATIYDINAFHNAQVRLVPESAPEFYPPVYPPHVALLFTPFSGLTFRHALLLWSAITIACFGVIVRSAWRPVSNHLPDSVFAFAAAAAFPPFWSLVLHGQVTILVLGAFWAGWMALERERPYLAGVAFGLLLIKPQFAIPLAVVAITCGEWSMIAGAVTSIAIQVGAALVLFRWAVLKAYLAFVPVMAQHGDLLEPKPFQSHSLRTLTRLAPSWIGMPLWVALSAVVLYCTVRVWRSTAPLRVRFGMIVVASVLVNPHLIVYDATVLVLPLIWFGAYVQEQSARLDAPTFWTVVYWLFVTLLAPTAAVIWIQVSVVLMVWLALAFARSSTTNAFRTSVNLPFLRYGFTGPSLPFDR